MKTKRAGSKRVNSSTRHKIERKKREHKRDLRRAAKALKAGGAGPKRSKKARETAKMALKISNAHPDKEEILTRILQSREQARVVRADRRAQRKEDALRGETGSQAEETTATATGVQPIDRSAGSNTKNLLFVPNSKSGDFCFQFQKALTELVYPIRAEDDETDSVEVPAAAYLVTVDARCAVQSCPWTLLDAIVERGEQYAASAPPAAATGAKRPRNDEPSNEAKKQVLVLLTLTKVDLVSAPVVATQLSLLADAIDKRYFAAANSKKSPQAERTLPGGIVFSFCPVATQFDGTIRHVLKMLRYFNVAQQQLQRVLPSKNNLKDKICVFVCGLPSTGRRSLTRALAEVGTDSSVAVVPLRAAQVQLIRNRENDSVDVRLAFPNAKNIVLVQFPEDAHLRNQMNNQLTSGDIVFQSAAFVERLHEPEAVALMLLDGVVDRAGMSQAFCQPLLGTSAEGPKESIRFLKGIGYTVRREKGFHVSPLFVSGVGTAGQLGATSLTASTGFCSAQQSSQGTLLDSSFSAASPNKLIRISAVVSSSRGKGKRNMTVKRIDGHNVLRIGARTFVREFFQSKHVPWGVLRAEHALTPAGVAQSSWVLSLTHFELGKNATEAKDAQSHLNGWMEGLNNLLRNVLVLLPHRVVEMNPASVVPVLHDLTPVPAAAEEEEESDDEEGEEEEEELSDEEGEESEEGEEEGEEFSDEEGEEAEESDEEIDEFGDDDEDDEEEAEEEEEEEVPEPPKKQARREVSSTPVKGNGASTPQRPSQQPQRGQSASPRQQVAASPAKAGSQGRSSKGPSPRK